MRFRTPELAIVALSLVAAWLVGRRITPRLTSRDPRRNLGWQTLHHLQFPLTALALVLVGRLALKHWQTVNLLNLMVPLLTALAIMRFAVLVLRQVFAPSGWRDSLVRMIGWVVWIGFALHITGLAADLLHFLDGVGFTLGKHHITLLLILQATISVLLTLLLPLWLGRFIEARLMAAAGLDINLRVMFANASPELYEILSFGLGIPGGLFALLLASLPADAGL